MKARVVTVPFREETSGFDGGELAKLVEEKDPHYIREYYFVTADGLPGLACFVAWFEAPRELGAAARADEPRPKARAKRARADVEQLDELGERVRQTLKRWRAERAKELGVPAYRVLTNRQLDSLARTRPNSMDALASIEGLGARTRASHGREILERVRAGAAHSGDNSAVHRESALPELQPAGASRS